MARALRLEFSGALYHITSRGDLREDIYEDDYVLFEPLDFISKLGGLVPKPRVDMMRYHGVLAPNSKYRVQVTPAKRGKGAEATEDTNAQARTLTEQHTAMTCAR